MKLVKPKRNKSDQDVFHTSRDCPYVTQAYLDLSETTQPAEEFRECAWCSDSLDYTGKGTNEHGCPFCGESVDKLPDHLPCEASP
jgi:hypothetical protein